MKARSSNVVKFPYDASRRVHARKPRGSKNGTPEERAAKAAADARIGDNLTSVPSQNAKPTAAEIYCCTTEEQAMIRELQIREAQSSSRTSTRGDWVRCSAFCARCNNR